MKVTIYRTNGTIMGTNIKGLEAMQKIVGGYIEPVYVGDKVIVVDEEGLLKSYPVNEELSKLAGRKLVGDGFVVSMKEWMEC